GDVDGQLVHTRAEHDHDAELLAAVSRELLDEESGVAARVTDVADRAGDLPLHRLEDRIELGNAPSIQNLLLLPMLREQRHLLHARVQLGPVSLEIERALRDRAVLDLLGPD